MSANEHNDWNDSLDFESLADEHDDYDVAGNDEFVDEDLTEDPVDDLDAFDEPLVEDVTDPEPMPEINVRPRTNGGVSGAGLGVLFAFSILVAAIGSGGALMTALGVDPVSLWQPQGLSQVDQLLNLDRNPLNLVYIVLLATALLTMLGAWAIARTVRRAGDRANHNAHLLDLVADLRIDEERGWQSHDLKNHPALISFVEENVGTWRLLEARQRRATGLEGELQRLAKAAAAGKQEDLEGRFDHPAVGTMADELLRQIEARSTAQREADAIRAKDREESEVIVRSVSDAAGWNLSFTDQVGVQNAAVKGLESRLGNLCDALGQGDVNHLEEAQQVLDQLRREIHEAGAAAGADDVVAELHEHVEKGTKLAFQIAMEVARLGQRGERLLPMTQALEELATNFRKTAERMSDPEDSGPTPQERWERHLQSLQDRLGQADDPRLGNAHSTLQELTITAGELAERLGGLSGTSDLQTERLRDLGQACASLLGVSFDPDHLNAPPTEPADANDLGLTRFDPFSGEAEDDVALQVDPFATGDEAPVDTAATVQQVAQDEPEPSVFAPAPAEEPTVAESPAPTAPEGLGTWGSSPLDEAPVAPAPPVEAAPAAPAPLVDEAPVAPAPPVEVAPVAPAPPVEAAPVVPAPPVVAAPAAPEAPAALNEVPEIPGETVYDLGDLGGIKLDAEVETPASSAPAEPDEPSEPIYDLSEFGAVRLS